ncbi:uncharacterized protein LOC121382127 isoform X1 [Gigantopelta aegis]|uniref:uncharacterized protein LOC121382127 isoform X1 n=1 Tax=Gigantopelta aegis TaxID=1735272 RepID=UPI001B88B5B5|nr:uncharacterized protein LOC121382127 isoform X1 [Gigantopelta aegis]
MNKLQMSGFALLLSVLLAAVTQAHYLPYFNSRAKRQTADVQAAEYLAWIALGGRIPHRGCPNIACGVVDVVTSGKRKRNGLIPENPENLTDAQRAVLVRQILQKAQEEVDKTKEYSEREQTYNLGLGA